MATGVPETKPLLFGPWLGHDGTALPGTPYVRNSLNVVFDVPPGGGPPLVKRRPGRMGWLAQFTNPVRRVANLLTYVTRHGAREIIAWLDPATASATDALLYRHDGSTLNGTALTLPEGAGRQRQGGEIPHVQFYGTLILLDSYGRLLTYDGRYMEELEAYRGENADLTGDGYLTAPPSGRFLVLWRNRLAVLGGEAAPRTVSLSASNGSPEVPYNAPVGGPNVWPVATNFDVQTDEGDEITGGIVLNDRLIVTTHGTVTVVDEDAVAPIARVAVRHAGCVAPRTLVSIGNHVVFLGDRRIFRFDGAAVEPVSVPVEAILKDWVNWDAIGGAVAVNFGSRREYRIWLPVVGDGENRNRLCLIWNYATNTWRVAAGWYLFDRAARRNAANHYEVTCAMTHRISGSDEVLLTGAHDSTIFMEDVGDLDYDGVTGTVFPAYIELPEVERGAEVETFRDIRVDCLHDGSFVEAVLATDGREVEQEIVRVLDGDLVADPTADDIPYVQARALKADQRQWADGVLYPVDLVGPVVDELKLGLAQRGRKSKIAILLPGQQGGAVDAVPGGIHQVEPLARSREGRR